MSDALAAAPALLLERLLVVIDEGRRTGTHKLLTLLAVVDAAAASVGEDLHPALWVRRLAGGAGREVERLTPDRRAEIAGLLGGGVLDLAAEESGSWSPSRVDTHRAR